MAKKKEHKRAIEYGSYSAGVKKCGIGFKMSRDSITLDESDEQLQGAQIACTLRNFDDKQSDITPDDRVTVNGVADIHAIKFNSTHISGKLSFTKTSVDREQMERLISKEGFITYSRIGDAGDGSEDQGAPLLEAEDEDPNS